MKSTFMFAEAAVWHITKQAGPIYGPACFILYRCCST